MNDCGGQVSGQRVHGEYSVVKLNVDFSYFIVFQHV